MITLENIHVRSRLQDISVSVRGSGSLTGHLLDTTYNVGVPAITDQPVGWAVPAPSESALVQGQPESQAGELCTGRWESLTGSHHQPSSGHTEYCSVGIF